jgi:prepilin signal peptidase PulO-like enzyme (type II secretory pathway)
MEYLLVAVAGIAVGAVVNWLGTGLPERRWPAAPSCDDCRCGRPWWSWIGLVAWLVRRRCGDCGRAIGVRHPLVEIGLSLAFCGLYALYGPSPRFYLFAVYAAVFLLIVVTDLEHRLILNVVVVPAMALAVAGAFLIGGADWWRAPVGGLFGYGCFWLAEKAGGRWLGEGALGGGDVKLAGLIGLIAGFPGVFRALMVGILGAGLFSLVMVAARQRSLREGFPYGPFLVLGGCVALIQSGGL